MKVRTNYVSNSSSSSFCIVGVVVDEMSFNGNDDVREKMKDFLNKSGCNEKAYKGKPFDELVKLFYEYCSSDEQAEDLLGKLKIEYGISEYYEQILLGYDIEDMRDDEFLGQFKDKVFVDLKKLGFTGNREDVKILKDGGFEG